jgi:acetylornithine/succinyldiaminopimelate/putrescine aminotransferase
MPLGAFIGRAQIMHTLSHDPPLAHVTTFGGHPVSCAAGLAALDVVVREALAERAARVGAEWLAQLETLIGGRLHAVRGKGLLMALEFERPEAARAFSTRCFEGGLILNWTLHRDTVVRLAPPLTISGAEITQSTDIMREALTKLG